MKLKTTRRSNRHLACVFAAAVAAGLGAASAFAQSYYPPTSAPFYPLNDSADLKVIDTELGILKPGETIAKNPASATTVKSSDFVAAVAKAVADAINGTLPNGTPNTVTVETLISAASKNQPAAIAAVVKAVATTIVDNAPAGLQATYLEQAAFQAALVAGSKAPSVASSAVAGILASKSGNALDINDNPDIVAETVDAAPTLAGKTIAAVIAATKKGFTASTTDDAIVTAGVKSVIDSGAAETLNNVATATLAAAAKAAAATVRSSAVQELTTVFLNAAKANGVTDKGSAIQLAAGLAAGGGAANVASVKAGADASGFSTFVPQMDEAIAAYNDLITNSSTNKNLGKPAPGTQIATYIGNAHPTDLDATVAGAVAAWPKVAASIILGAVTTPDASNTTPVAAVITAGVKAYPAGAALDAKALINFTGSGSTPGSITAAIIAGTTPDQVGLVVANGIKGFTVKAKDPAYVGLVTNLVSGSIAAAEAKGISTVAAVAFNAAKASHQAGAVATAAIGAAQISTNPVEAAAILAGAVSADYKDVVAIQSAADGILTGEAKSLADLAAGLAGTILNPPKPAPGQPKDAIYFFEQENIALGAPSLSANQVLAIVYATTQANPKGTSAIVGTAIGKAGITNPAQEAAIVAAATASNYKAAPNIQAAADAAVHVNSGVADLFTYVANQTSANPALAVDVVTGATAAAPQYTHIVAHAIGFADPAGAAKAVPALFSFSSLATENVITHGAGDQVSRAALITAGVVDGLVESFAPTDKKLPADLKAVVSAAVKAAISLKGPTTDFQQSDGTATGTKSNVAATGPAGVVTGYVSQVASTTSTEFDATITAVLAAAAKSAKGYVLEIAQAAASAAASIYLEHNATIPANAYQTIAGTLQLANLTLTLQQIDNAIAFGVAQAKKNDVSLVAGGAGVSNGSNHFSVHPAINGTPTGLPVTSIFDL